MKKEMTALIRNQEGNLKIIRDDWFLNKNNFAEELKGNGYKVLKIWNGYIAEDRINDWEFLNRKR